MTLHNPVGCDLALLLLPRTGLHVFLQENKALHTSYSTLCPFWSTFVGDSVVESPPCFPLASSPTRREVYGTSGANSTKTSHFKKESFLVH